MDSHFFIKKISALKEDFYAGGPGLLDTVAHLDIYERVRGCAGFQLCQMVLAHDTGCADVRCPRPGPMVELHSKSPWGKSRHISPACAF